MNYKLFEIIAYDWFDNIGFMFYRTAPKFSNLLEDFSDLEELGEIEIKSIKEIENFDCSNEENLYRIHCLGEDGEWDYYTTDKSFTKAISKMEMYITESNEKIISITRVPDFKKWEG